MSRRQEGGVRRGTLDAAVPAQIIVSTVPVVLAIRRVMLGVVADEVGEREAVVAGVYSAMRPSRHRRYALRVYFDEKGPYRICQVFDCRAPLDKPLFGA
jgi:hypothetical protein